MSLTQVQNLILQQATVVEDAPTSLRNLLRRKVLKDNGISFLRATTDAGFRWCWALTNPAEVQVPGIDFSDILFDDEAAALHDAEQALLMARKRYSMGYVQWTRLSNEAQATYLKRHNLEFLGYTITGVSENTPESVEFTDASILTKEASMKNAELVRALCSTAQSNMPQDKF